LAVFPISQTVTLENDSYEGLFLNFASRNFSMVHFIPMKGQDTHKVRARFGDHHMVDRKRENFLGKAGCFLSHVHVAKHVVHMNASNVVVLEDDATFMNFPADARSDLADLSLLGGRLHRTPVSSPIIANSQISLPRDPGTGEKNWTTFAGSYAYYLGSPAAARTVLVELLLVQEQNGSKFWKEKGNRPDHIDLFLSRANLLTHVSWPMAFTHSTTGRQSQVDGKAWAADLDMGFNPEAETGLQRSNAIVRRAKCSHDAERGSLRESEKKRAPPPPPPPPPSA
jgi:hypothetical protein